MSSNDIEGVSEWQMETMQRNFKDPAWFQLTPTAERFIEWKYAQLGKDFPIKDEESGMTKITPLEIFQMFWPEISSSLDSPIDISNFIWANNDEIAPSGEQKNFDILIWIELTEKGKTILEMTYIKYGREAPTPDSFGRIQLSLQYIANIFWELMTDGIDSPIEMGFKRVKDSEIIVQDTANIVSEQILEEDQWIAANDENYYSEENKKAA